MDRDVKEAFFGHLRPLSWQSPAPETTNCPAAFMGLNWGQSIDRNAAAHLDPALGCSLISSSPSSSSAPGSVVIREFVAMAGGICNSGEISSPTQLNLHGGAPLNSPPKMNLSMLDLYDAGFAERAARSSCFAGGGQLARPETGKLTRAPSGRSLKWENSSPSSDPMTGSDGAAAAAAEGNSRKRKAATAAPAKCKGREAPSPPPPLSNKDSSKSPEEDGDVKGRNAGEEDDEKEAKPPEPPQKDYVHVRAKRGQATDSHSLAERVRREKISERMKFLQDLVPGCSKVTGKAVMLDEIINYVQSLQRQVEFLSMKLATMNLRLDFGTAESFVPKDVHQARGQPLLHSGFSFAFPSHQEASLNGGAMATSGSLETSMWQTLGLQLPRPTEGLGGFFDAASGEVVPFWEDDQHSVVQMGFG